MGDISDISETKRILMVGAKYVVKLYSKTYNQELLIFGEKHKKYTEKDCKIKPDITLIEYLSTLLSPEVAKNKFYDVFIERTYLGSGGVNYEDYPTPRTQVDMVNNLLKSCYSTGCPYQVRLHHVDYRMDTEDYKDNLISLYAKIRNQSYNNDDLSSFIKETEEHLIDKNDVDIFFGIEYPNKIDTEIKRIDPKFSLEAKRLHDTYNTTKDELYTITDKTTKAVDLSDKLLQGYDTKTANDLTDLLNDVIYYFINYNPRIMDIYTLARIFHHFGNTKKNQKPTVEYGIFYGGAIHSKYLTNYLIQSGYTVVSSDENDSGCVLVPSIS